MIFDLKVNGQRKADGISTVSPIFSWECETEQQFTVQMSSNPVIDAVTVSRIEIHHCTLKLRARRHLNDKLPLRPTFPGKNGGNR